MALTPSNDTAALDEYLDAVNLADEAASKAPTKTWKLDFERGRIGGFIDGDDALRQYIAKALITPRDRFAIYSDDYGNDLFDLIGADATPDLLDSEIPRMIEDALIYDDRIDSVDVSYTNDGGTVYLTVTVTKAEDGEQIVEEVAIDV